MSVKERLIEFIESQGISVRAFERQNGFGYTYVASISKGIGAEKLATILGNYPMLSREWLLYGEGKMIKEKEENSTETEENKEAVMLTSDNGLVYYYDMVATASDIEDLTDNELNQPYITLYMPGYEGCVGFNVAGDSMTPTAKHRDIVAIERKQVETIINGEIYFIVTRDGQRMIKRLVQLGKDEDGAMMFRCISDNPNQELYAPFVISGDRIHTISRVKGFISHTQLG